MLRRFRTTALNIQISLVISSLTLVSPWTLAQASLHFYVFTQKENVGDQSQALGFAQAVQQNLLSNSKDHPVELKEFQTSPTGLSQAKREIETDLKQKTSDDQFIALFVGESGIDFLRQFSYFKSLTTVHLAHQVFSQHSQLIDQADFVVIPNHAVTPDLKKSIQNSTRTHLLTTVGVFHNLKESDLEADYSKNKALIPASKRYLGVILAGDAPSPTGKTYYFTEAEAEKLAHWIARNAVDPNTTVLVLNGPRTGKFDPKTGQVRPNSHRNGTLDPVTTAFMKKIKTKIPEKRIALFDFQFDQPSLYKTVLAVLRKQNIKTNRARYKTSLLVPGESTSMISETLDILASHDSDQVILYENGAMNENHYAHLRSELENGKARTLTYHLVLLRPKKTAKGKNHSNLNLEVVQKVVQALPR